MSPKPHFSNRLLTNIFAALTLAIVSLSLGAAFGIMSGRGAFLGMLSAAVLALVTSLVGGTRVQCSGPTAPVTVLVTALMVTSQSFGLEGITTDQFINLTFVLAGIFLFLAGIFRLGRLVALIPNVVTSGFMSGVGLVIFFGQLQKLWSYHQTESLVGFWLAVGLVVLTFGICWLTPKIANRSIPKWSGIISGTLLSMVAITVLVEVAGLEVPRIDLGHGDMTLSNNFFAQQLPGVSALSFDVLKYAVPLALQLCVAMYLDSLLTSVIVDRMTKTKTKRNRELLAQGVGGVMIGCLGGIPGAQATVRSVLLVKEGADMRLAGILVGVFALLGVFLLQDVMGLIPQVVFIGVLLKVGLDIIDTKPFRLYCKELLSDHVLVDFFSRHDDDPIFVTNREIILVIGTTLLTLFTNLIVGVVCFTTLYHVCNRWLWRSNPIRDLEPLVETDTVVGED